MSRVACRRLWRIGWLKNRFWGLRKRSAATLGAGLRFGSIFFEYLCREIFCSCSHGLMIAGFGSLRRRSGSPWMRNWVWGTFLGQEAETIDGLCICGAGTRWHRRGDFACAGLEFLLWLMRMRTGRGKRNCSPLRRMMKDPRRVGQIPFFFWFVWEEWK